MARRENHAAQLRGRLTESPPCAGSACARHHDHSGKNRWHRHTRFCESGGAFFYKYTAGSVKMFRRNFCKKQPQVYPPFAIRGWQKGRADQPEATPQMAESATFSMSNLPLSGGQKCHFCVKRPCVFGLNRFPFIALLTLLSLLTADNQLVARMSAWLRYSGPTGAAMQNSSRKVLKSIQQERHRFLRSVKGRINMHRRDTRPFGSE